MIIYIIYFIALYILIILLNNIFIFIVSYESVL